MTKRFTDKDLSTLQESGGSLSLQEMADLLGREKASIYNACRKYGIPFRDTRKENSGVPASLWDEEKLSYLKENAPTSTREALAEHLHMTVRQVAQALDYYKIEGRGMSRKQTPEEIEKRVSHLRGVQKVDREALRECPECQEMKPVFQYPSENQIQSSLCEECRKAKRSELWKGKTPEEKSQHNYNMRGRLHGLTHEDYDSMIKKQEDKCYLCRRDFVVGDGRLRPEVDHDHACCVGRFSCGSCIRGLLCHDCNLSLGRVEHMLSIGVSFGAISQYLGVEL